MKTSQKSVRGLGFALALYFSLLAIFLCCDATETAKAADAAGMVPLNLKLPPPAFKGTPKDLQLSSYVEPLSDKPRPPMMVPSGLKNLAKDAKMTSSDKNAASLLEKINDGDKEASDQSIIFLRKGSQWIQMDLGRQRIVRYCYLARAQYRKSLP